MSQIFGYFKSEWCVLCQYQDAGTTKALNRYNVHIKCNMQPSSIIDHRSSIIDHRPKIFHVPRVVIQSRHLNFPFPSSSISSKRGQAVIQILTLELYTLLSCNLVIVKTVSMPSKVPQSTSWWSSVGCWRDFS